MTATAGRDVQNDYDHDRDHDHDHYHRHVVVLKRKHYLCTYFLRVCNTVYVVVSLLCLWLKQEGQLY